MTTSADSGRNRLNERHRLVGRAAVLAMVVVGTTAFATLNKTVTLDVDGEVTRVSAFGRTVDEVLGAQGIDVGEGDLVAPGGTATVRDGSQIVVRHGRDVIVEVDGVERTVWTTALTVDEILAEMGLRGELRTSVSRSDGLDHRDPLRVSTLKTVHVEVDGSVHDVTTTASTVRESLRELQVVLGEYDRVSVPLDAAAVDGLVVKIDRVAGVTLSGESAQPYQTVQEEDSDLARGQEIVSVEGREGRAVVTYVSYQVGGVEIGRKVLAESVVTAAVDQVVRVGTSDGPDPADVPTVEPGTARAIALEMVLARGWDQSEFACLDELWSHESGWRVNASNSSSGAYGIPQALPGSKMASVADDWQTNPATQITWGLGYVEGRYGTPCGAWGFFQSHNWY